MAGRHASGTGPPRWVRRAAIALLAHPELWVTALVQLLRLARPGWWRADGRTPTPDPSYLSFRVVTAYGDDRAEPSPADVVSYLRWCRAWPRVVR